VSRASRSAVVLAVVAALFAGCTTQPTVDVDPNKRVEHVAVSSYTLVIDQMPGFLAPMMRDELVAALDARGAREVAAGGDVEFRLRFRQVTLDAEDVAPEDRFDGTIAPEEATRFVAEAVLTALLPGRSKPVLVGSISRVHAISAGAYMHARSRAAIRRGFDQLLDGFLTPVSP
jgi:hypothetical protein